MNQSSFCLPSETSRVSHSPGRLPLHVRPVSIHTEGLCWGLHARCVVGTTPGQAHCHLPTGTPQARQAPQHHGGAYGHWHDPGVVSASQNHHAVFEWIKRQTCANRMFMAEPAEGMNPTGQWLYSGEGRVWGSQGTFQARGRGHSQMRSNKHLLGARHSC